MNVIYTALETSQGLLKKVAGKYINPEAKIAAKFHLENITFCVRQVLAGMAGYISSIKSAGKYLVNALMLGLKQNLFGTDVDMEFLVLSARVYFVMFISLTLSFSKYLAADRLSGKVSETSTISAGNYPITSLNLISK